jgi:N-carbamoyl-L-amino-acid hydrolase
MRNVNSVAVDGARLIRRHAAFAKIGATGRGGVDRQALTDADIEGRILLVGWAQERGFACSADGIGNLFIRRRGRENDAAPVLTGSHLDTQPTGGNFDGVFGVLAGLELLETFEDHGLETLRPVELVVWTNEEGARFQPATMGSAVFSGVLSLDEVLAVVDRDGVSVASALQGLWHRLPGLVRREHSHEIFAYVEAHIEQGPVLENTGRSIGVVTGIQGMRIFAVEVVGETGHAGTTPVRARKDALVDAMRLATELGALAQDANDVVRFTIGRFDVMPDSPNTIPGSVSFSIDLRHPDDEVLSRIGGAILHHCSAWQGTCDVSARELLYSHPVQFDMHIRELTRQAAHRRGYEYLDMFSGATHDAKFVAALCPTGMIFVPCKNGISHSEAEMVSEDDLIAGTNVLYDVVTSLSADDA